MLSKELLKANAALNGLTDEQVATIVTLSQNDEDKVIGTRFGEVYRQLDDTIAKTTGVSRNGDEKTYLYLERAATELKAKADASDALTKQVESLTKEKAKLEKTVAEGSGGEEAKRLMTQAQKDLANVTKQYVELKEQYEKEKADHAAELLGIQVEGEIKAATAGVKFKKELPTSVTNIVLSQAVSKIKGMNPEYVDDGKGGKTLVFKDETGAIMRNSENVLNPYTASELLVKELQGMGVLDEGRKQEGSGTQPLFTQRGNGVVIDVSGAKTQTEAHEVIATALMQNGLTNGSKEFADAMDAAWKDNNVSSLPVK